MFRKKASAFLFMKNLETERLILQRYTEADKERLINLFADKSVMKYVDKGVLSREQSESFWQKLFNELYPQDYNIWAIFLKEELTYIGHAGIYPRPAKSEDWEFVYFLHPDFWGRGFATEIACRVIKYGFEELNLKEIFATVDDEHKNSIRVLEKSEMLFQNYEYDEQGRYSVYSIESK